jgi:hypothetical protein
MKISTEVRMTASDGDERFSVEPADFVVAAVRDGTLESDQDLAAAASWYERQRLESG